VAASQFGLLLKGLELALQLGGDVVQPEEVLFETGQLTLGPLPAPAVLGDAGGLLDELPPLLGPGGQDVLQVALRDDGVEGAAEPAVGQQLLDVEQPARAPAEAVLALSGPEDGPAALDLGGGHGDQAGGVVDDQLHLRQPERGPPGAPGEDHVAHLGAPQRSNALLAQHPGERIGDVRLAGPVGDRR